MVHISSVFLVKHEEHISRLKFGSVAVSEKFNSRFNLNSTTKTVESFMLLHNYLFWKYFF